MANFPIFSKIRREYSRTKSISSLSKFISNKNETSFVLTLHSKFAPAASMTTVLEICEKKDDIQKI